MDIKIKGLADQIFVEALTQAKKGRLEILEAMKKIIAEPRKERSPYAPSLISLKVNPDKIRFIIGPGGEIINKIIEECGIESLDIDDDGTVVITSKNQEGGKKAYEWVLNIVTDPEVGKIYENVKVTRLLDFGALVQFMPGKEGMVHISEIANEHVTTVADHLKIGQLVTVKLMEIDGDRFRLSIKRAKEGNANA